MRLLWLCILGVIVVWPIHWTAATVGDKPIDLMASDMMFLLTPITYFFIRSKPTARQLDQVAAPIRSYALLPVLALIFIVYATALAGIGLGMSGELVRLYSAFKLAKPVGFVFLGMLIGSWGDPLEFIDITSRVYGVIVALTTFSTLTAPEFPMGDWGKCIFEWELSGYPNSPMSFYAGLVPLLLASADAAKNRMLQLTGWGLAGCCAVLIIASMSRSSIVALFFGCGLYLLTTDRVPLVVGTITAAIILGIIGYGLFSAIRETEAFAAFEWRIQVRVERSTETEDPSSGRFEIWATAIELWTERPVFGYMFESFSRYASVDTPHQQYLEVLHKCGGLGLIIYFSMLISCFLAARRLRRIAPRGTLAWFQMRAMPAMLIGIMIGNLTQPNLTYSLTGNMVFLVFGCLCSSRAVISASQPNARPRFYQFASPLMHRMAA